MTAVYANREDFVVTDHARGPNMMATPQEVLMRISDYAGVALDEVFVHPQTLALLKRHTRFARQNGIHASPTVMVNGLVDETIASRDEIEVWADKMGLA